MSLWKTLCDGIRRDDSINPNPIGPAFGRIWSFFSSKTRGGVRLVGEGVQEEVVSIAAAATTDSVNNLLVADSYIWLVSGIVLVKPGTNTATFSVGDAVLSTRFGTGISTTVGTRFKLYLHLNPANANNAGPVQAAAAKIRITPNVTPNNALGSISLCVVARLFDAPTV